MIAVSLLLAACGKRGDPLAPLRPVPARIANLTAHRVDDRIELAFTIPAANLDGTTPPVIDRIEIYGLTSTTPLPVAPAPVAAAAPGTAVGAVPPAGAAVPPAAPLPPTPPGPAGAPRPTGTPAPSATPVAPVLTAAQIMANPKWRLTTIPVRRDLPGAPASTAPGATAGPRLSAGDTAVFIDRIVRDQLVAGAVSRQYVAVGYTGLGTGRAGPVSGIITVPLVVPPVAPHDLTFSHDETTLTMAWQPGAPGQAYRVFAATPTTAGAAMNAAPLTAPVFTTPVEFGKERCFAVRAVQVAGPVTIESALAGPACFSPVDTYSPPAPSGLRAIQEDASVSLAWEAVDAPDLVGYLVFRGEGTGEILRPLTVTPVASASFKDTTVRTGVTYVYAIVAQDAAGNPSPQSNRQTVTVR